MHRDLKPANVLAGPKITDFGTSKLVGDDELLTREEGLLGTVAYMSPEQIESPRDVDARSDLWAIGVLLYEAVTGKLPFGGTTDWERMQSIVACSPAPPSRIVPSLPPAFDRAIVRALAPRDARYESARAFGAALLPLATGPLWARWAPSFDAGSMTAQDDVPLSHDVAAPRRRSRIALPIALIALATATALMVRRGSPPSPHVAHAATNIVDSSPATPVTISAAPSSISAPPHALASTPASPLDTPKTTRPPVRLVPSAPSPASSPAPAPAAPTPVLGDNGAPILE